MFLLQAVDQRSKFALQNIRQVIQSQTFDAVVGDAALGVVVRADACGAIAGTDLELAVFGDGGGSFFLGGLRESGGEALHCLVAVGVLRTFRLRFDHDAGRDVGDADGGVGFVDVLTAGARGAERVDTQIGRVDFDRLARWFDRDDRNRCSGRMDATLRFRFRYTLNTVRA